MSMSLESIKVRGIFNDDWPRAKKKSRMKPFMVRTMKSRHWSDRYVRCRCCGKPVSLAGLSHGAQVISGCDRHIRNWVKTGKETR